MFLLATVNDPHELGPMFLCAELDERHVKDIKRRHEHFMQTKGVDEDLAYVEYNDDAAFYYSVPISGDVERGEVEDLLYDKGYVEVPQVATEGAEQVEVYGLRLVISEDTFFWSAYVKHTACEVSSQDIYFKTWGGKDA